MNQSLNQLSLERFKKNAGSYVAIGLMCGLFLVLLAMLSLINDTLVIIAMALFGLPIIFASQIACYYLKANQPITISAVVRYQLGFFRPQFRSSFKAIKSFLLALAFYAGSCIVSYLVLYAIYNHLYGETFVNGLANLIKCYTSTTFSSEEFANILTENNNLLLTFFIYVSALPLPVGIIYFLCSISYNSLSIYYRNNMMSAAPSLIRLAVNNTYVLRGRSMRKDWLKLNWPIIFLSLLGSILGAVVASLIMKNANYLSAFIILGSVILLFFYLPFYFPAMEVLFERYESAFMDGNKEAIHAIISRIQNSIELSEDEKKSLEDSFRNDDREEK